jgi:hypothetical protein
MGMMAQIGINSVEIKSPFRTVISTLSSHRLTNHATLTCNLHPDRLALPCHTVFHPIAATTTTTPHARTTTPFFLLTMQIANKTTTMTPRPTSLSLRKPTLHIPANPTALTTDKDNLVVDVLTDDSDAATVEVRHLVEDVITTTHNGPEMVST